MSIRIIVADDHAIIREGLRVLLETQADMQVLAIAANGREAVKLVDKHQPQVVIMDISMPELNGVEAMQQMLARHPQLQVIVLSIHAAKPYILRAMQAGAKGYLLKETAGLEVVDAIRAIQRGERYLSRRVADLLLDEAFQKNGSSIETSALDALSPREREVLQLVAEGKTSHEIAAKLSLSSKSVDSYRSRLMQKIGVTDLAGLIRFAIQNGVISIE